MKLRKAYEEARTDEEDDEASHPFDGTYRIFLFGGDQSDSRIEEEESEYRED